ncbi:MAG TPA: DivIVA domain-containing protein [Microbacteriaceae bacterium]|nr:DivIVA domain-containing protein [Microbacteriaceae bacterium]
MALTPNDVLNKQFQTTKFRDGYDQDEVDDFLDEVLAEFQRLIAENEQLKSQAGSAAAPSSGEAEDLRAQLATVRAQLAETQQQLKTAQDEAASGSPMLDGMNSAEYLQLARRVHEEHVREGVAKRDEAIAEGETKAAQVIAEAQSKHDQLISEAESKATELTNDAQAKADRLVTDAQSKADELVAEAKTQRDTQLAALAAEVAALSGDRDALQSTVDELKEFERTYRSSLKTYLETQLGDLKAIGADSDPADEEETGAASDAEADVESTDSAAPIEDTGDQPRTSFQWEPPARAFEAPAEPSFGSNPTSETPPVPGLGGN